MHHTSYCPLRAYAPSPRRPRQRTGPGRWRRPWSVVCRRCPAPPPHRLCGSPPEGPARRPRRAQRRRWPCAPRCRRRRDAHWRRYQRGAGTRPGRVSYCPVRAYARTAHVQHLERGQVGRVHHHHEQCVVSRQPPHQACADQMVAHAEVVIYLDETSGSLRVRYTWHTDGRPCPGGDI